jgi:hypothetical protein
MTTAAFRLLNIVEAAESLKVSPAYLEKLRSAGGGPRFVKMGTRIAYDPADLAAWVEALKHETTAEPGSQP